jgi:hypothetical protein
MTPFTYLGRNALQCFLKTITRRRFSDTGDNYIKMRIMSKHTHRPIFGSF